MYDFVTDLLNINKKLLKSLDVIKGKEEIPYPITLHSWSFSALIMAVLLILMV